MSRCVARSPKEMVKQVAAIRELDAAEVGSLPNPQLSLSELLFAV